MLFGQGPGLNARTTVDWNFSAPISIRNGPWLQNMTTKIYYIEIWFHRSRFSNLYRTRGTWGREQNCSWDLGMWGNYPVHSHIVVLPIYTYIGVTTFRVCHMGFAWLIKFLIFNFILSLIDIRQYFIVSISLTISLFSPETSWLLGKKCFWSSGASNPQPLVPTIELKRRALAISTVGSLNKSCGSKVPYKDSIALVLLPHLNSYCGNKVQMIRP
jgi:hypothetical protein